jgi:hypothetical protein
MQRQTALSAPFLEGPAYWFKYVILASGSLAHTSFVENHNVPSEW